jgi:hypothetical protein
MRSVSALPSGSRASSAIETGTPVVVAADVPVTIAARFGLGSSLCGPRWHV